MGQSTIKNSRRIFTTAGGDPSLPDRVIYLENNEYKILYFQTISATTGTITKPTNSTILLDQFYEGGDAVVETLINGQPTGQSPLTAGGAVVSVSSFDASGNFTLSGTPSSFDVALVYILKIKAEDYQNLVTDNIMAMEDLNPITQTITNGDTSHAPSSDAVKSYADAKVGSAMTQAINEAKGSDIASAATTDIGAATGNFVHVTGTTTITALGTIQAGTRRIVRFAGALTLTHNATSLILPTGANITTAANDVATFVSEGSGNWRCVGYMKADGTPLAGATTERLLFMGGFSATNLGDSVTYYFSDMNGLAAQTTQGLAKFSFNDNKTVTKVLLTCSQGSNYSNESVSVYLRENATTDNTITTTLDLSTVGANTSKIFSYSVSISVLSANTYEFKVVTPAFGTNGTNSRWLIQLYGY